jgi:PhnB protein
MEESTQAVTGDHTDRGTPHGFTSLTPFHVVRDAAGALEFYQRVFGARVIDVTEMPDAKGGTLVAHATLDFGRGRLQIADPMLDFGLVPPPVEDAVCSSLAIYVPDVDAVVAEAEAAGASVREPVSDFVSGDRFGSIRDPHGIRWTILTRVEDLSDEESAARVREWTASAG